MHSQDEELAAARRALTLGRKAEAEAGLRRLLARDADNADALQLLAVLALQAGRPEIAVDLLERAIAAAGAHPSLVANLAVAQQALGRGELAEGLARRVFEVRPDSPEAWTVMARAAAARADFGGAWRAYARAVAAVPGRAEALSNLADAAGMSHRPAVATRFYRHALAARPGLPDALAGLSRGVRQIAAWADLPAVDAAVLTAADPVDPMALVAIDAGPEPQLANARAWAAARFAGFAPLPVEPRRPGNRLRIGYLSSDFHLHATAILTARLFELHDRAAFEVTAYSCGRDDGSAMRARLRAGFDRFVDLSQRGDLDAARRIRADGIDILVEMKGYTRDSRMGIAAFRPAPVQIAWLGFPGSSGAEFIDYVIGDPTVTPPGDQSHFSEALLILPDCYQSNDDRRDIAAPLSRPAYGLPEDAIVLAAFNETFKITPPVFAVWMGLLRDHPSAVLWLMARHPVAQTALRDHAARAGIDPVRLIFAPWRDPPAHRARYKAADLFLDTTPYNGHTTMSDALWGGCPAVTMLGDTFAARVGASLLRAAGLPELVAAGLPGYDRLARALIADPVRRAAIRRHLETEGARLPLFDSGRFTRHLEAGFRAVWARHAAGLAPATTVVQAVGENSGT